MSPAGLLRQSLEGLALGSVYALVALGYTMIYGVLGLINFAHADVLMVGAYVGIFVAAWAGSGVVHAGSLSVALACLLGAMAACAALGVLIERLAYRPIRGAPRLTPLVTAIGVSMLLENVCAVAFGSTPRAFPELMARTPVRVAGVAATNTVKLVELGAAVALMAALEYLVARTRFGRAMRAVATNPEAARLMGVPVDRVIAATFALGSALAGAGGVLVALDQPRVDPMMGVAPGLKAFVAAVLGGIGSVPGAMLGGVLIGLTEQFATAYVSSSFAPALVFAILVGVLLVRPQGLLGGRGAREKV